MNNKFLKCGNGLFLIICFFAIIIITSCKKAPEDTSVVVTCVDTAGKPVNQATVIFYVDSAKNRTVGLPNTQVTKVDGKASIEFPNGILLDVKAFKKLTPSDSISAKTIILLNPGNHLERTLKLQ